MDYRLYMLNCKMKKLLTKIIESGLIYHDDFLGHGMHEIVASNILESEIGETIVEGVCKGLLVIAEEEGKTLQEIVDEILDNSDL